MVITQWLDFLSKSRRMARTGSSLLRDLVLGAARSRESRVTSCPFSSQTASLIRISVGTRTPDRSLARVSSCLRGSGLSSRTSRRMVSIPGFPAGISQALPAFAGRARWSILCSWAGRASQWPGFHGIDRRDLHVRSDPEQIKISRLGRASPQAGTDRLS